MITKEKYLKIVHKCLDRLYSYGLTQTKIAMYLGVTDRAVRKWEYFESVPSGVQFLNLEKLCKELGV